MYKNSPDGTRVNRSRGLSLVLVFSAYGAAFGTALVCVLWLEVTLGALFAGLAADGAATAVIFIFSMIYRNSSTYDPYWSTAPPVLYFYWASRSGGAGGVRTVLILIVTCLWCVRLTSNWIRDWPGLAHEDWRYREFRGRFGRSYPVISFLGIHLFPTVIVALASLPVWAALNETGRPFGLLDIIGGTAGLGGVLLSFIADEQMRRHRRSGRGGTMTGGLWGVSRHPNYLGEILFWFSLWFFALGASSSLWWTGAGAAAMYLMFRFVSVPWMQRRLLETRPGYAGVIDTLPALIPRPGRRIRGPL